MKFVREPVGGSFSRKCGLKWSENFQGQHTCGLWTVGCCAADASDSSGDVRRGERSWINKRDG